MSAPTTARVLRASPNANLALTYDGRAYVAKDSEPYIQFWLTERYRKLLSVFQCPRGMTENAAIEIYFRMTLARQTAAARRNLTRAIADMIGAGVLVAAGDELSRYDAGIVASYLEHRPFPREIAARIIEDASIAPTTRVLDLAGGPGDLAVQLAGASREVSLMDLSLGFLHAARKRARHHRRVLTTLHDSCNRLLFRDECYDVITVAQALHWLDDVMICRGVLRALQPGGRFFVVHGAMEVAPTHPSAHLFGADSILGKKTERPFEDEAAALQRRLSLLFEALDTPDVDGIAPVDHSRRGRLAPLRSRLFRQRRPIGAGYARAFLTPSHIEITGMQPSEFWADVDARFESAPLGKLEGTCHWALLQYGEWGDGASAGSAGVVEEIGYPPPRGG